MRRLRNQSFVQQGLGKATAVTTPARLSAYLSSAPVTKGLKKARRALKLICPNSRSPKESQLCIETVETRPHGGFHLQVPLLNEPIPLDPELADIVGAESIVPDFWWPEHQRVIEYDSDDFHDEANAEHDARQRSVYDMLGLQVTTLTYGQVKELKTLRHVMHDLERKFGIRRGPSSPQMMTAQEKLHAELYHAKRRPRQAISII